MTLEELIRTLHTISMSEVREFEEVLAGIGELHDPGCIPALAPFLDDEAEFPELMSSILRTMEAFDSSTYVDGLLKALPLMWGRAPGWAATFMVRVINSDKTRTELIRQLKHQPADRRAVVRLIVESTVKEWPEKQSLAAPVLAAAA